jgi:hypothetical protein
MVRKAAGRPKQAARDRGGTRGNYTDRLMLFRQSHPFVRSLFPSPLFLIFPKILFGRSTTTEAPRRARLEAISDSCIDSVTHPTRGKYLYNLPHSSNSLLIKLLCPLQNSTRLYLCLLSSSSLASLNRPLRLTAIQMPTRPLATPILQPTRCPNGLRMGSRLLYRIARFNPGSQSK